METDGGRVGSVMECGGDDGDDGGRVEGEPSPSLRHASPPLPFDTLHRNRRRNGAMYIQTCTSLLPCMNLALERPCLGKDMPPSLPFY